MTRSRLSTPRQLTLRYVFALGLLGVLAVVNYRMFRAEIREGEASTAIQQVSARHRLLFQQCVVLAEQFVHTDDQLEREDLRRFRVGRRRRCCEARRRRRDAGRRGQRRRRSCCYCSSRCSSFRPVATGRRRRRRRSPRDRSC